MGLLKFKKFIIKKNVYFFYRKYSKNKDSLKIINVYKEIYWNIKI